MKKGDTVICNTDCITNFTRDKKYIIVNISASGAVFDLIDDSGSKVSIDYWDWDFYFVEDFRSLIKKLFDFINEKG